MKIRHLVLLTTVTLQFVARHPLWSQAVGSIQGKVTDSAGAVIPQATVTATNLATNFSRSVQPDANGIYSLKLLPPSIYTLEVAAKGFKQFERPHVELQVDQTLTIDAVLEVGSSEQVVTVDAGTPLIDTATGTLGQVIDQQRMIDLPLNGRNAATLTTLVAGTATAPSNGAFQASTFGNQKVGGQAAAVTISVNGGVQTSVNYQLDGGDNVDQYTDVNQPFPMPDSLQEFSVQTSNYSAQYGQNAGGIVNVVTKSGTDHLHGDLFEYVRNDVFNARNWASSGPDHIKRNQFGGTLGGPIRLPHLYNGTGKTFFFFGYQATIFHYIAADATAFVPTSNELNGDFSSLLEADSPDNPLARSTQLIDPQNGLPFPGNQIPTNRFDQAALAVVKDLPLATSKSGFVNFEQPFAPQDFQEELIRIDHSISPSDHFTGRYFLDAYDNPAIYADGNILTYNDGQPNRSQNLLLQEIHSFNPRILNDARIAYSRINGQHKPPSNAPNLTDFGVRMYQPENSPKAIQSLSVDGMFKFGDHPFGGFVRNDYTLYDDVKWQVGRHNIGFGGLVEYGRFDEINQNGEFGGFDFSGDATGFSLADFLLGSVRSFSQQSGEFMNLRDTFVNVYAEDSIRLLPRFTVTLGVRYEPYQPWDEIRGREEIFNPNDFLSGKVSLTYPNAPPGLSFAGDPGFPTGGTRANYNNISPRIGFAYDVFGDHTTSLRGGFGGFFNSRVISQLLQTEVDENPFSPSISLTTPEGPFSNPYLGLPPQSTPPFPFPAPKDFVFPLPTEALSADPFRKFMIPVTYEWNLTAEREIGSGWLLRSAYVGSRGLHIRRDEQWNPVIYRPGGPAPYGNPALPSDSRRMYMPGLTSVGVNSESGESSYHSLQVTLEKRLAQYITLLANYTYSKSLDDIPPGQTLQADGAGEFSKPIYDPTYNRFEYGPSPADRTHSFVASYVLQLPQFLGRGWFLKQLVGGWQWSGITTVQSGDAETAFAGKDQSLTDGNDRAIVNSGKYYGGNSCSAVSTGACKSWFDSTSFSLPLSAATAPAATYASYPFPYGNAGKGSLRGPGFFNWDMGLHKQFPLSESLALQFRAEFFNSFNHVNFSDPDTTINDAAFGAVTSAGDPRIGQLALKLAF